MSGIKKINNPFVQKEDYNCFGCSPNNKCGLHLMFSDDGEFITAIWDPKPQFEGFKNVLHGGIQTTLLDEIASWTIYTKLKTAGVTSGINIKFKKPVLISKGTITLKSKVREVNKRIVTLDTYLLDSDNQLCCEAEIKYFVMPEEKARVELLYPGVESFYIDPAK